MRRIPLVLCASIATALLAAPASAQCRLTGFEEYTPGTVITTQYAGVTFSAQPDDCTPDIRAEILQPPATSDGTRCLCLQTSCGGGFSPEFMRLVFDDPMMVVSFTLGAPVANAIEIDVRAYDTGDDLIFDETYLCGAGPFNFVEIGGMGSPANIKRVEIEAELGNFEAIDELKYSYALPVARIDQPLHLSCECGVIDVRGEACDFTAGYKRDWIAYKPVPGSDWTFIDEVLGAPLCGSGHLHDWNPDAMGVGHGRYTIRLRVENECGLFAEDYVDVVVDRQYGTASIARPTHMEDVAGKVMIEGSAKDSCGSCFDHYTVQYGPSQNGPWTDVDPDASEYTTFVVNGILARWNTTTVPDGTWVIKLYGEDVCGHSKTVYRYVNVDNANGLCPDVDFSGEVDFGDLLEVLSRWGQMCP